jgi:nickel-dependent lactate racemase
MRIAVEYGHERAEYEVPAEKVIATGPPPPALPDPAVAIRAALESPVGFPPLRRALTPDDHVAVVVDDSLPHLGELLVPLLEDVVGAGVAPEAVTLLCPPAPAGQPWLDELPDSLQEVRVEVADAADRRRLSYLATTRAGRRLYLNRTLVDADQVVVLSRCRYDPVLGHSGAEGALFPALSDDATRTEVAGHFNPDPPASGPWPVHAEAVETAWLLGAPFFVQVIEAAGDGLAHVVAGTDEASREARRLLDASWKQVVERPGDLVVAGISGDPARHTFADLAAALANAARVVRPGGRIVLLTRADPTLGDEADSLRGAEDAEAASASLGRHPTLSQLAALQWARAAGHAQVALLSGLPGDTVEELFATPLQNASQAQRLLDAAGSCLFLADAHKALTVLGDEREGDAE